MYEVICYYIKQKQVHVDRYYIYITAAAALASAVMLRSFSYTFSVLVFFIVLVLLSSAGFGVFKYKNFWLWIGASFLPFCIFNYILTSLPVVIYSEEAVLGIRAATIPVEDFLYSFVLLTSYLTAYLAIENVWKIKKT
jgi:lycopene cyclase domain-containing protein